MTASISEYLDQQIRASVNYLRMLSELRGRIDQAKQLDDALHSIERPKGGICSRQETYARLPGMLVGRFHAHVVADFATQPSAFRGFRTLAGQIK